MMRRVMEFLRGIVRWQQRRQRRQWDWRRREFVTPRWPTAIYHARKDD